MTNEGGMDFNGGDVAGDGHYQLRLFVVGTSTHSIRAISNIKTILTTHLEGRYELEVIDVHQQPLIALSEDVTAVPMLIVKSPASGRRLIGDMSNTAKVLKSLGLTQ
ncbi:circadian clock KaiB family protein [Pedobacter sp. MC2016-14]|uniref:circadian clock KaiB family protein n=1 Tax=Pedobacter sp. MC2016-14 TaxID=2897327 RepID=UPI001E5A6082|nr:circadian clock KaiB family protein [Pedobacter sp. MC2016-14]MCD0487648.1 circadian clock KaiB family protein [Pedobacter sp. MC2016-14]